MKVKLVSKEEYNKTISEVKSDVITLDFITLKEKYDNKIAACSYNLLQNGSVMIEIPILNIKENIILNERKEIYTKKGINEQIIDMKDEIKRISDNIEKAKLEKKELMNKNINKELNKEVEDKVLIDIIKKNLGNLINEEEIKKYIGLNKTMLIYKNYLDNKDRLDEVIDMDSKSKVIALEWLNIFEEIYNKLNGNK